MHRKLLLSIDLMCVSIATLLAFFLRDGFELSSARLADILPYLAFSAISAALVLPLAGAHRVLWRYGTFRDFLRIPAAALCIMLGAVSLCFVASRLEDVSRALPPLQGALLVLLMASVRLAHRWRHAERRSGPRAYVIDEPRETVLVVGANAVADALIRSIAVLAPERISVAGVVARGARQSRVFQKQAILGAPEDVARVLEELETHGVFVDRIIVTEAAGQLSREARRALQDIEAGSDIAVDFMSERISFARAAHTSSTRPATSNLRGSADAVALGALTALARSHALRRPYWAAKRIIDALAATALILLLAPVIALVCLLVLADVGSPLLFWQLRPGALRRPFKLYKFRTMRAAHDQAGRPVPEALRVSRLGHFLRRTRLDELPQLFQILTGEMSFVGPRPLLDADQAPEHAARLAVRPGLSGWAQVNGGRALSPSDKAAMDIWYVHNASLRIDLIVAVRTLLMVLLGERRNAAAVREAWRFLGAKEHPLDGAVLPGVPQRRVA